MRGLLGNSIRSDVAELNKSMLSASLAASFCIDAAVVV